MPRGAAHTDEYYLDSDYADSGNDTGSGYGHEAHGQSVYGSADRPEHDTYDALEAEDRDRYFRERDEYYRERDEYYRRRDEYYDSPNADPDLNPQNNIRSHGKEQRNADSHSERKEPRNADPHAERREQRNADPQPEWREQRNAEPHSDGKEPRKKSNKKAILAVIASILIFIVGFVAFKLFTAKESGYYTVAVFGVDSREGKLGEGALSDVNIIARVDLGTGEIKLVSIYRDTYTRIDEEGNYHKFNEAYFRGGPEQAIWALEHNTDVKVDDYATFNWKAVVDAINILGGVDVDITDAEFKYINAFITETVNGTGVGSYQLEHAGPNHLDGVQAVAYARLRLMDNDYVRTERQRKIVSLAMDKAKNADYATLYGILVTVLPQINTSVGLDDMLPFVKNIGKYYLGDTAGFPFEKQGHNVGKLDCVVPVTWETNNIALHEFLYPDIEYTPSELSKEISEHVINVTGLGPSGDVSVSVDDLGDGKGDSGDGSKGSGG